jgi:mono/diheme cytochrome c family protein
MDAPAKPALCGVTRSKSKGFGSEGEFTSPQRGKKFARTANFWTITKMSRLIAVLAFVALLTGCEKTPDYVGAELYAENCANCHGVYGEGDGPMAPALSVVMLDLRYIADRNGGTFPRETIRYIIDGRESRSAHGERDMPIWGSAFAGFESESANPGERSASRIEALVDFLETVQIKE